MATHMNELGGDLRCRDEVTGKYVNCEAAFASGCSGGCSLGATDKLVPFDLPVVGESVQFDLTDGIFGALGSKALTGVATAVLRGMGEHGERNANWFKVGVGVFAFGGLLSERLRESSLFLGFSFASMPETAEPLTDKVGEGILWLINKVTGKEFAMSGLGRFPRNRRIGQVRGAPAHRPQIKSPAQLIREGKRQMSGTAGNGTAGIMSGSAFRRPVMKSMR